MNTISSSKPLKEDFERRYRKNLEMLNPNAAGLDLHKEEIWVCPGGFQDNHEPEVKTFGTLTGELRNRYDAEAYQRHRQEKELKNLQKKARRLGYTLSALSN